MKPKRSPQRRDLDDPNDILWTVEEAAGHFGMSVATVERYIREGLPSFPTSRGRVVEREQFLAEWRKRRNRNLATRSKSTPA